MIKSLFALNDEMQRLQLENTKLKKQIELILSQQKESIKRQYEIDDEELSNKR